MTYDNYLITKRIFSTHAETYRTRFWDVSRYTASLNRFASSLPASARVLELGCGPGNVTSYLLNQRPDLSICATDFSPEMVSIAKEENPSCETRVLDVRDLGTLNRRFEGIVSGFVIPYLNEVDTRRFLCAAADALTDGGILYVSGMVESDTQRSGIRTNSAGDTVYMYYHRAYELCKWIHQAGFDIFLQTRHGYPAGDGTMTQDLAILARKSIT